MKVLYVDDTMDDRERRMMSRLLTGRGLKVKELISANEALREIDRHEESITGLSVLCDGLNGYYDRVYEKAKQRGIGFVLLTADEKLRSDAIKLGLKRENIFAKDSIRGQSEVDNLVMRLKESVGLFSKNKEF